MPRNEFGQPIGDSLTQPLPTGPPAATPISGNHCRVEPLDVTTHVEDLWTEFSSAEDGADWAYLFVGPFETIVDFRSWLELH